MYLQLHQLKCLSTSPGGASCFSKRSTFLVQYHWIYLWTIFIVNVGLHYFGSIS